MMRRSLKNQLIGVEHVQARTDTMTDDASESLGTQDVNKYQKYSYLRPQMKSVGDTDSVKLGT